jgi:hypothetical protein
MNKLIRSNWAKKERGRIQKGGFFFSPERA